jgi:hypothetical protein
MIKLKTPFPSELSRLHGEQAQEGTSYVGRPTNQIEGIAKNKGETTIREY